MAKTRNLRMSARKVRLVAGLIRGLGATAALDQLKFVAKAARLPVEKTLRSALANAEHNHHIDAHALSIAHIMVDKGMFLKRWRPRAFGRAAPIHKHSCHITIILSDEPVKKKNKKETKSSTHKKNHESRSKNKGKGTAASQKAVIHNS